MKIAVVRGDFLSSWEIANSQYFIDHHDTTFFVGTQPVHRINFPKNCKVVTLFSPADLNFGKVRRWRMAILNRLFIDAHVMLGLEDALRGFDVAYVSETYYGFTHQCLEAKRKGYLKSVVSHASENTPFNNEGIWGKKQWKNQAVAEMDKYVAITGKAKEVLIAEGCDPKKIVRLQPGVDLKIFHPQEFSEFRGIQKNNRIKLLFVGRLIPEKGVLQILDIFEKLLKKYTNIELIIADSGPLTSKVEQFAASHKNVFYLGRINPYSDMGKLYNLCDIYLHYSIGSATWVEQYGFNLIEAMACGLPVIGLDRGSVSEVVGNGGLIVSEEQFVPALEKMIKNAALRFKTGLMARKQVKLKYNAYKHSRDLANLFATTLPA